MPVCQDNTKKYTSTLYSFSFILYFSSLICVYFIWFVHGAEYVAEVVNSEG